MTTPITPEQLATLLPQHARIDTTGRQGASAEWTTDTGNTWTLSAHWRPEKPAHVAILGPGTAVILDDPTADDVAQQLRILGAIPGPALRRVWFPGDPQPEIGTRVLIAAQPWTRHPNQPTLWITEMSIGTGALGMPWDRLNDQRYIPIVEILPGEEWTR